MNNPEGLKFSKSHEWARQEGGKVYIGITDHAQHALGDIVFIELPKKGTFIKAEGTLGVVESVKAASDVYSPVAGTVIEVNEELADAPEKINQEPYESWIAVLGDVEPAELDSLMNGNEYEKFCAEEG